MSDDMQSEKKDFMIEKIKQRPLDRGKLMRRTLTTAAMAVMFGLIACFTFLLLEPVINDWLYPEEPPQMVFFPEDPEEMSPEEMLTDTMQSMQNSQGGQQQEEVPQTPPEQEITLEDEQIQDILSRVVLDREDYQQLYVSLSGYVNELKQSMVTVTGITSNVDWLSNAMMESSIQSSGVIIADNGREFLILTDYEPLEGAELLMTAFYNGLQIQAYLKQYDATTGLAVLGVPYEDISKVYLDGVTIAALGTSNGRNLPGVPVAALGRPMGTEDSLGYGMITGESQMSAVDARYKILQTDIYGSQNASGFLFNMKGQLIGVITDYKPVSDMRNMISAYGISDLRRLIEKMSNQIPLAYLGVRGIDVSTEANGQFQVPFGAYVSEVALNSPAMLAGIQRGDVIVRMGERQIENYSDYISELMLFKVGEDVEIVLMRQVQEEYKEITLTLTLGESGKGEQS